ncbi:GMP synthase (glutamine-hydrolyzing) [Rhizina undulata]
MSDKSAPNLQLSVFGASMQCDGTIRPEHKSDDSARAGLGHNQQQKTLEKVGANVVDIPADAPRSQAPTLRGSKTTITLPSDQNAGRLLVAEIFDTVLVLDYGSQYSHLITLRLRELNVYAEMLPCTQKIADLTWKPKGVILSGSPYSVYNSEAPHVDSAVFELGVPVLGVCYGLQETACNQGKGHVGADERKEYGHAALTITRHTSAAPHVDVLLSGLEDEIEVWMSHGDKLKSLPPKFLTIAATSNAPFAGIAHTEKPLYGIQFRPKQNWAMTKFVDAEIERIKAVVGHKGQIIGAFSGGVDSIVAAKLMHEAIGDHFHAILVNNGVMRLNECQIVHETLTKHLGINLTVVDASEEFLSLFKRSFQDATDIDRKNWIIPLTSAYLRLGNMNNSPEPTVEPIADITDQEGAAGACYDTAHYVAYTRQFVERSRDGAHTAALKKKNRRG